MRLEDARDLSVKAIQIPTERGYSLQGDCFTLSADSVADKPPTHCVVVNSALAVPRQFYRHFAAYLATRGCVVITYDYRGLYDVPHPKHDQQVSMRQWGENDMTAALNFAARRYPDLPLLVVGHSAGANLLGLASNLTEVDKVLAVAAPTPYFGNWQWPHRLGMLAFWYLFIPTLTRVFGYFPGKPFLAAPVPRGVAQQWARWARTPHFASDEQGKPLHDHYRAFTGKMKFIVIADDAIFAPESAVDALANIYCNAAKEKEHLSPHQLGVKAIGHFNYFRPDIAAQVWPAAADWLMEAESS